MKKNASRGGECGNPHIVCEWEWDRCSMINPSFHSKVRREKDLEVL